MSLVRQQSDRKPQPSIFDKLYGTRFYTEGAQLQLPRKVPLRVEPKSYFALERTYLSWMGMAVTMGGVSSALVGFQNTDATTPGEALISRRTIDIITCVYTPISMLIMVYALFTFEWRAKFMHKKQMGMYDDKVGPTTIAILVLLTLIVMFVLAIYDFLY